MVNSLSCLLVSVLQSPVAGYRHWRTPLDMVVFQFLFHYEQKFAVTHSVGVLKLWGCPESLFVVMDF